ncbi:MAG: hypothetical protein AAFO91_18150, partial [Bacteroidota bacterium]
GLKFLNLPKSGRQLNLEFSEAKTNILVVARGAINMVYRICAGEGFRGERSNRAKGVWALLAPA